MKKILLLLLLFKANISTAQATVEVKKADRLFQQQFAQTMAALLAARFICEHPVKEKKN